ncbi:3-phosphoshikimate 1-carboxyvinyltransferase [bacterium]|jgi:3-phosphoshikimate 1-carboxyvinyltransferase|nr:3-phosphoshikimate 1-carboxyvinyltransferase [bacterium]
MSNLHITPVSKVAGEVDLPGDKSISHRAVILASIAEGNSEIRGFLRSDDCLNTVSVFRNLGVDIEDDGKLIKIKGAGKKGLKTPGKDLYFGNSGTGIRLTAGAVAGYPINAVLTGDESLSARPMSRIITPLSMMGCNVSGAPGKNKNDVTAPLKIKGGMLEGIFYDMPVSSAQVKSCILIAGLNADGTTIVNSLLPCRDHTEKLLEFMGGKILVTEKSVAVNPEAKLHGVSIIVPGDFSSAAFLIAAALVTKKSELLIKNVGLNPTRTGFLKIIQKMGAKVEISYDNTGCYSEQAGDIFVRSSSLRAVEVSGKIIPNSIDEIPVIALLATFAEGTTVIRNAGELRHKESDRISNIVSNLKSAGADIQETDDGMIINGPSEFKAGVFDSKGDHRIAMAMAIGALTADKDSSIEGSEFINTSFPGFEKILKKIAR